MAVNFSKGDIELNKYQPERCGVDFTERLAKKMGEWATETEVYTVWVTFEADEFGEAITVQGTPDNMRTFISELDDDSDTVSVLDPRDGKWFVFNRGKHNEIFDTIVSTIAPWSTNCYGLLPQPDVFERFLESALEIPDELPEDFFDGDTDLS